MRDKKHMRAQFLEQGIATIKESFDHNYNSWKTYFTRRMILRKCDLLGKSVVVERVIHACILSYQTNAIN